MQSLPRSHSNDFTEGSNEYKALQTFLKQYFDIYPPELSKIIKDRPQLKKLAELLSNLLGSIDTENARAVEMGFRHLLNEYQRVTESSLKSTESLSRIRSLKNNSNNSFNQNSDALQQELMSVKKEKETLEKIQWESREEIKNMQDEIEELYINKNQLSAHIGKLQREFEDMIQQERAKTNLFEDKYHDAISRLKLAENTKQSLENQLKLSADDYESVVKDYNKIKVKLTKKTKTIGELNLKLQESKTAIVTLQADLNRLEIDCKAKSDKYQNDKMGSEAVNLHIENGQLAETVANLAKQLEEQQILYNQLSSDSQTTIQKLNGDLNNAIQSKNDQIKELHSFERVLQEKEKQLDEMAGKLEKNQHKYERVIHELEEKNKNLKAEPQKENNPRAIMILNGYTAFVQQLFFGNEINIDFLGGLPKLSIQNKSALLSTISNSQKFVSESSFFEDVPLYSALFGKVNSAEQLSKMISDAPEAASLVIAFSSLNSRLIQIIQNQTGILSDLRNFIDIDAERDDELAYSIVKYHRSINPTIQFLKSQLSKYFDGEINDKNIFDYLKQYMIETSEIVYNLENELRETVSFEGDTADLPKQAHESIIQMLEEIEESRSLSQSAITLDHQTTELKNEIKELKQQITKLTEEKDSLDKQLLMKNEEISKLQEQMEDAIEARNEQDKAFQSFHLQKSECEQIITLLQNEKERLLKQIADKETLFNNRFKDTICSEQQKYENEIARLQKRITSQAELFETKMHEKQKKITQLKKDKEAQSSLYEKLQKTANDTNLRLIQQNKELAGKLKNSEKQDSTKKAIKIANNQRETLINTLNNSLIQMTPPKSPRYVPTNDNDFYSEVGEALDKCFKTNGMWTKGKVLNAVSKLIDRVLMLEQMIQSNG